MLMARPATRTAKPNVQCYIHPERDSLQRDIGIKTGVMLWNYTRVVDNWLVGMVQESKSVGAEVSGGVKVRDLQDANSLMHYKGPMMLRISGELVCKFQGLKVQILLGKILMERVNGNSKSFHIAPVGNYVHRTNDTSNGESCSNQISSVPPLCHLDMGVVESLPSELLSELIEIYGGKLVGLIAESKGQGENYNGSLCFFPPEPAEVEEAKRSCNSDPVSLSRTAVEMKSTL